MHQVQYGRDKRYSRGGKGLKASELERGGWGEAYNDKLLTYLLPSANKQTTQGKATLATVSADERQRGT